MGPSETVAHRRTPSNIKSGFKVNLVPFTYLVRPIEFFIASRSLVVSTVIGWLSRVFSACLVHVDKQAAR